jgi:hypothetical protein
LQRIAAKTRLSLNADVRRQQVPFHTLEFALDLNGKLPPFRRRPRYDKYGIYVIQRQAEVIRIGESSSGFDRIAKGFREKLRHNRRGKERKNYLAYSWRDLYRSQSLTLKYFALPADPFSEDHLRRALEAEVTFQFRIARGAWPSNMSEIHFLERYRRKDEVVAATTEILELYGHRYDAAV